VKHQVWLLYPATSTAVPNALLKKRAGLTGSRKAPVNTTSIAISNGRLCSEEQRDSDSGDDRCSSVDGQLGWKYVPEHRAGRS
jgi:hypothetical protein